MIQGFKDFISRGNAIDLAVGVVIGAAFTGVVNAIVDKFFNPLVGAIFGEPNFDAVGRFEINGVEILPGAILTALASFLLVAVALYFFIVLPMNKLAERRAAGIDKPEAPAENTVLLTEIRDLLREQSRM
ncbi:large conductance mechanosensitive channel protein MscL [Flaviflexus huanghaiensis]|uniref:large conductance mechanosensitive channel protein MscL n=1 Tax=Flaviflexus huanghaiensis TaxID=1111473 RepID=UPI0015F98C38|nr:large conductance mechanosensitive channel protein MscL [Flaviflexus huanghaiensis]